MAFTQTDLDAVNSAIASGELQVRYSDREVVYRSISDLLKAKSVIEQELQPVSGKIVRQIRPVIGRGW